MYLEHIASPVDVKALPAQAMEPLCTEIRDAIIDTCSRVGGHLGPNLGVVELSVALHRVFNTPTDKLVFDVSHQTYTHKILTGRARYFTDPELMDAISGFSSPGESEHDLFSMGHTSTSVGLALGLAKARELAHETYNVVAIIGDGSLSGGLAFESLDNAAEFNGNLIIVVNDNEWSIAQDQGSIYKNLAELRATGGKASNNIFTALGFEYHYLEAGNNEAELEKALSTLRDTDHPVILHIHTTKGLGYKPAMENPENWHHVGPFERESGSKVAGGRASGGIVQTLPETYADITGAHLLERMQEDPALIAISSATPYMMGFTPERRAIAGKQFVDVGIAEEHAVTFATGLAKGGAKPVYGVYGTFLQRTYDQLWHDACLNNAPITLLVYGSSAFGTTDVTHLGFFDIAMLTDMPRLTYLAPTCCEEYLAMLDWAIDYTAGPVAIRVPGAGVISRSSVAINTAEYDSGYPEVVREGTGQVAILALGSTLPLGLDVADDLAEHGASPTLINPRFACGLSRYYVESLARDYRLIVTLEDGVLEGGFGDNIARLLGASDTYVRCYGLPHGYPDRYDPAEMLASCGLTRENLTAEILKLLEGID